MSLNLDEIAETIARGERCPCCEQPWRPNRRHGGSTLVHLPDCEYLKACDQADEAYFAMERAHLAQGQPS